MTAYRELEQRFRRLGAIEQAISVLHWDTAAIMPAGGAAARAEQLATLRLIAHQHLVAPEIEALLAEADAASDELGAWQRANLREMRRRWLHATAVPGALVEAESRACSECEAVWRRGRLENDFAAVLPGLERIIHIEREIAAVKAERLGKSPYEALLDQYEPDASVAEIDRLFDEIAEFLPDLIEAALSRQAALPSAPVCGPFPIETQRRIAMRLMERIGFDFAHGRLDISAHPFCGGTPEDVRITTRYDEDDFARLDGGTARDRARPLSAMAPGRMAASAGRPCPRHGNAREPIAAARNAGVPKPRFFNLRGPDHPRGFWRRCAGVGSRGAVPASDPGSARFHSRRCR